MKAPNHPTGPGRQRPRPAKAANPTPAAAPAHVPALLLALLVLALGLATACVRPLPRPDTAQPANPAETAAPATPSRPMAQAQPTATPTVAPTAAPIPTSTPTATPAPTVTPTVAPTPPPTATPPATPTATPTPTVTPTAAPTPTPPPTITPTPENQPLLEILTPLDRSVVRQDSVNIQGVTEIGGSVSVRGQVVAAGQGGRFQLTVPVSPGVNNIDVIAIDAEGNRRSRALMVTFLPPEPFFLTVTQPTDGVVFDRVTLLWGRTAPDANVTVNGVAIPVDHLGIFSTTITLRPGENRIHVLATSAEGQSLAKTLTVTLLDGPR